MKLHILSDLHLEFAPFTAPETDADVIVLAGDIGVGLAGLEWAARQQAFKYRPIIYVSGNHEFYGARLERIAVEMRKYAGELGIHYLDNDTLVLDGVRFLGATLWTDFELFGSSPQQIGDALHAAKNSIADFSQIIYGSTGWLRPEQTVTLHRISRQYITDALATPFDGPTVVVTHHVPSQAAIEPRWHRDIVSACFTSPLDELVIQSNLWIAGHTHGHAQVALGNQIGKGRLVVNPRGYPREESRFVPDLVIEVEER